MEKEVMEMAVQALDQAIKEDPTNAQFYRERGRLYMMLGRQDLAVQDVQSAMKFNPDIMEGLNGSFQN